MISLTKKYPMPQALDSALDFLQDGEAESEEEEDDEFDMFDIYEESPDFDIPYDLIAELEERDLAAASNKLPSAEEMNTASINAEIARWRKHDKDVGSAEVQVAIANARIKYLTKHLLANKKDVSCRRGLQTLVNTRRKFLNYLYENNKPKAELMVKELGIRFRPPGRLWDKAAKYGAFKNTKSKWQKLRAIARAERDAKVASKAASALASA
jgi:small subunit ribosomal protein S15